MGRRFLTRMISLSPSQTSFHSSTGDGDSRAKGFWEIERCRQIRFNYQVSEQLQILQNPSRFLFPDSEEESHVNAAVHADWQKTLTPTSNGAQVNRKRQHKILSTELAKFFRMPH